MKKIAIITARSGSKGIKDKNIRLLAGKPLMAHSILAARESGVFDEIMVSTDSQEYAEIAKAWGASVPFLRSADNSTDHSSSWDTVREVLDNYNRMGIPFDAFCLLQPTSPLRTAQDIINASRLIEKVNTAVISVCELDYSPMLCNQLPEDHSLAGFIQFKGYKTRQDMGKYYRLNGAIYFVRVPAFYENPYLYRDDSVAYIMDKQASIDIDDEMDFELAEFFIGRAAGLHEMKDR